MPPAPQRLAAAAAASLLLALLALQVASAARTSVTYDEPGHRRYGAALLRGDTTRFDDSKMPVSALNALPGRLAALLPAGELRRALAGWPGARLPTMLGTAGLALLVFVWARRLYGARAGLLALALTALDPNLIAHGSLVTTDLWAALAFTLVLWTFWRFCRDPGAGRGLAAAVALGAALAIKYSAVLLPPILLLLAAVRFGPDLARRARAEGPRCLARPLARVVAWSAVFALVALLVVNAAFLFQGSGTPLARYRLRSATLREARAHWPALASVPLPVPYAWLEGLDWVHHRERTGEGWGAVYLRGELRERGGFPGYYLWAWAYKVPLPTQLALVAACVLAWRRRERHEWRRDEAFLLLPPLLLAVHLNLFFAAQMGVRYSLMLFPPLYVFCGSLLAGPPLGAPGAPAAPGAPRARGRRSVAPGVGAVLAPQLPRLLQRAPARPQAGLADPRRLQPRLGAERGRGGQVAESAPLGRAGPARAARRARPRARQLPHRRAAGGALRLAATPRARRPRGLRQPRLPRSSRGSAGPARTPLTSSPRGGAATSAAVGRVVRRDLDVSGGGDRMSESGAAARSVTPRGARDGRPLREAAAFVVLALGFAAAYAALVSASRRGLLPFDMERSTAGTIAKLLLRDLGPACAAVACAATFGGRRALRALSATTLRWHAPGWLWLLALLGPFAAMSLVVLVGLATGTLQRGTAPLSPLRLLVVFLAMAVLDGPLGEEIGWRGYLLPRLLERLGPLAASLAVGAVWWLWHVPLYSADGRELTLAAWATYLATTLALSTVFTWFWLRSGGSTLMSILLHDASNYAVFLLLLNVWVRVGDSPVPKLAHDVVLLAAGAAAAVALSRRRASGP